MAAVNEAQLGYNWRCRRHVRCMCLADAYNAHNADGAN